MKAISDLVHLFYPLNCAACGVNLFRHEKALCMRCQLQLPRALIHDLRDNAIERLFWGRVEISGATAFLKMPRHGMVHRMIHELKYRDNQEIGERLGFMFATELSESRTMSNFDMVVPVPLHPRKEKIRGYNQCHPIASGIQQVLQCEVQKDNLFRNEYTTSQTRKGRFERWQNVGSLFEIRKPELFENKRILLLDDVITTGATIEACVQVLQNVKGIKIVAGALAFPV